MNLLAKLEREAEVEPLLVAALALHPENLPLLQTQAELYLRSKRYAPALASYTRLHALQPDDPPTLLHFGFCLEQVGELAQSVSRYREAIARRSDFLEAHVDLAGVLWRVEDFEGALIHARKAVEIAPRHPYAVRILGTALLNLNRLEEAEATLRHALELQPGFALAAGAGRLALVPDDALVQARDRRIEGATSGAGGAGVGGAFQSLLNSPVEPTGAQWCGSR